MKTKKINDFSQGFRAYLAFLILLLFGAIQFSNATNPISLLQRPGNHLDDARITVAVMESETANEVAQKLKFEKSLTHPAFYAYKYLGLGSEGRRFISFGLILLGAVYLFTLVVKYGGANSLGPVFLVLLLSVFGGLTIYTSTGLNTYPLNLLLSVVLLHLALAFSSRSLVKADYLVIIATFSICAILFYRSVLGIYAAAFVISFCNALYDRVTVRNLVRRMVTFLALVALPTALAIAVLLLDTPPELTNPYRGLENYFFLSSSPKSVWGALSFYSQRSVQMFQAITMPHPLSMKDNWVVWVNLAFGILFILGIATSWKKPAFPVVLYMLVGAAGHIVLNLLSLVPYGNPRYFLNFFLVVPVVITLGAVNLVLWVLSLVNSQGVIRGRILSLSFLSLIAALLVVFYSNVRQYNDSAIRAIDDGILISNFATKAHGAGLVVDIWTQKVIQAEHQEIKSDPLYILKTNLKSKWRGQLPKKVDDPLEWRKTIEEQDALSLVTSMPFTESNYGDLFLAASEKFETVSSYRHRSYNFTLMLSKSP